MDAEQLDDVIEAASARIEKLSADVDRLHAQKTALLAAALASIAYDEAISSCANDPDQMSSYCTAQGDTLDTLYADWIEKSRAAIAKATP